MCGRGMSFVRSTPCTMSHPVTSAVATGTQYERAASPVVGSVSFWSFTVAWTRGGGGERGRVGVPFPIAPAPQVVALQQYAALFGRPIVTNAQVYAGASHNRFRLVPVDILAMNAPDFTGKRGSSAWQSSAAVSEVVYEFVGLYEVKEAEWMYQLQVRRPGFPRRTGTPLHLLVIRASVSQREVFLNLHWGSLDPLRMGLALWQRHFRSR